MFNWLGGRRPAVVEPVVKRAREVIAGLPDDDAAAAVHAITQALIAVNHSEVLTLDECYDDIQRLDIALVAHTRTLLREYLSTSRQKKQREHDLWNGAYRCWSELAAGYAKCVRRYAADARGAIGFRVNVPVACARALRALRRQLQWMRIRYAAPPERLWTRLAEMYAFVDADEADKALVIYAGEITTIKREFLKALMQSALSCEVLQPPGQDFATMVVSQFAPQFILSEFSDAGCTHWFDLKQPQAPARMSRVPQPDGDVLYFGAGAAVEALEQIIADYESIRELPLGLTPDDSADPVFIKAILDHVYQDWSGKTLARQHERRKVNTRITVVPGFKDIVRTLEFAVNDSLDFTNQPTAESWVVHDLSEGGYGAEIPALTGDWVEVGSLVGVQSEQSREWCVGVVRRLFRVQGNQQRVGIQLLSRSASLVRMHRNGEPRQAPRLGLSQRMQLDRAILLSADAAHQPELEILIRSGSFTNLEDVHMLAGTQHIVLRPKAVVERSAACERVTFTVLSVES